MGAGATTAVERPSIRRPLGWALVVALCVAAATACIAILTGNFDDTDARVIGTSLGFAVFSSTAAAGAGARLHGRGPAHVVGLVTVIASAIAFVLLVAAVWGNNGGAASTPRRQLAAEVMASADRIDALAARPEVSRECSRLRELARSLAE